MPAFNDQTRLIDSQEALDDFQELLAGDGLIVLDTEFVRTNTYYPKLCLIQVATSSGLSCIDVLADLDLAKILAAITDHRRLKVLHAAKQDMEAFQLAYDCLPNPIFDTQIAAGMLGFQAQIGYAGLVEELTGLKLDKGQTRTDWSRRPLTSAQIHYASDDVLHLAELYDQLRERLEARGRYEWAVEDSAQMVNPALYKTRPEDAWLRLSSILFQPVPVQARARQLTYWREARAQQVDRPRSWVLADRVLLAIANADPASESALKNIPDLPPAVIRKQGAAILAQLQQANQQVSEGRIEFDQSATPVPPDARKLKQLSGVVGEKAVELDMPAEILTTKRDLAALVRGESDIRIMKGWRREVIGEPLMELVSE